MIESEVKVDSAEQHGADNGATQAAPVSAGQLLRQARERQHVTIEGLAAALKVPVYKVHALEEDRWDALTDSIFTRALALSVCRSLHIPSEPVMALLPKAQAAKLAQNPEGINEPFRDKSLRSSMAGGDGSGSHLWKLAALLLIAAGGLAAMYWVPQWKADSSDAAEVAASQAVAPETEHVAAPVAADAAAADVSTPAAAVESVTAAAVPAQGPAVPASPVPATTATAPAAAVAEITATTVPAAPAAEPAASAAKPVLRVTASGETWVQVRDGQQHVVAEKILKAGDVFDVPATRPLSVVVGNADATKVEIDGAPLALAPLAKNNVARFEVK